MKKKVAICFSGQPRTWKKCLDYWSKIMTDSRYEINVFCHAWNYNTPTPKLGRTDDIEILDRTEMSAFIHSFNPFISKIEERREFVALCADQAMTRSAHLSQFYGIMASSLLKRQHETRYNFIYDAVIRARYDIECSSNILDHVEHIEEDTFHGFDLRFSKNQMVGQISDLCWMSSGLIYDRIAHLYLDAASIKGSWFADEHGPEHFLFRHLKTNLVRIKDHGWNMVIRRNSLEDVANKSDIW